MLRHVTARYARSRSHAWSGLPTTFVLLTALSACGGRPGVPAGAAVEPARVEVTVARAAYQPITRVLRVTGNLTADEEAEVAAETPGRVIETPVERGSRVADGGALIRIAQTEAEAAAQEAEANVAQIEVRLGIAGDQPFEVDKVPEVSNARAAMELATAEFSRIKKLYDEKVVSGSEFDQRRTQLEVSQRQHDTARNNARQLYRQLEGARARLRLARKALADTVVRSPFAGLVVERKVSVGDYVSRGTKVATVVRINPLRVELTVPEQSLSAVHAGQALDLEVDAYPGRRFQAQVRFVSPALRADQRALTIEAIAPNPEGVLKPGLFVTAQIQAGQAKALCLPSSAIRALEGSTRVYLVKGDHVEERLVTVGQVLDGSTEIAGGLAEGDEVAQGNLEKLADGTRVRVAPAPQPAVTRTSAPAPPR